jgi:hypothetical protein
LLLPSRSVCYWMFCSCYCCLDQSTTRSYSMLVHWSRSFCSCPLDLCATGCSVSALMYCVLVQWCLLIFIGISWCSICSSPALFYGCTLLRTGARCGLQMHSREIKGTYLGASREGYHRRPPDAVTEGALAGSEGRVAGGGGGRGGNDGSGRN